VPTGEPGPSISFTGGMPAYIPKGTIIPTIDDVPDGPDVGGTDGYAPGSFTQTDLAFLDANKLHFDFFMNSNNWTDLITGDCATETAGAEPHNDLLDIMTLHNPGNHTIHHVLMYGEPPSTWATPGSTMPLCCNCMYNASVTCDAEMQGIETLTNKMTMGGRPHLTRMRPPYGGVFPISGYSGDLAAEQALLSKYAVVVGWDIDDGDSNWDPSQGTPPPTGDTIAQTVITAVEGGQWGVILQHGTFGWTADALPKLYGPSGYFTMKNTPIATVEDAVCWKYGKHSWELIQQLNPGTTYGPN
jgi:hypothetical protein